MRTKTMITLSVLTIGLLTTVVVLTLWATERADTMPVQAAKPPLPLQHDIRTTLTDDLTPTAADRGLQAQNATVRDIQARYAAYRQSLKKSPGIEIAGFRTSLAGHDAHGRVQNIKLANQKINQHILMPGETFSFNQMLGDSNDPKGGWQLATVIVGKSFVDGYGGGICQVSTTLYNAVKQTSMKIDERHTHSLPVGYVPPGMDATVSYPELDFRFTNTYKHPIRLQAFIQDGYVVAKLYRLPEFESYDT
jgi:vancomycin resistance protein YoaR